MGKDLQSKIIQTVMQVAVGILCIFPVQGWAVVTSYYSPQPYWHVNLLDVTYDWFNSTYLMTEIVIAAAVFALVLNWTKLRSIMFIPIIVECAIIYWSAIWIMQQHADDSMVTVLPMGWVHVILVTASLVFAIYVTTNNAKKKSSKA